eukprot:PITA_01719
MVDCKSVSTPMELNFKKLSGSAAGPILANPTEYRQLVGALMFLVNTRPDICFAVNTLSQQMVEPHHFHWVGAKNLLKYLRGTINHGLRYTAGSVILRGYTDADWAGSVVDRKSTSGCCFNLGSASISWMSRKQKSMALSTAYHFIRDMVQRGAVRVDHIGTDEQVADILTKPLGKVKFLTFRESLGVVERPYDVGPVGR